MSEIKEKFTPGPWRVHLDKRNGTVCAIIEDKSGDCVARTVYRFHRGERNANGHLISATPDMYSALKMVCEDCEKLSNWEDMFNIGRPEGSIMPKCPCDGCYVKEALMKANGEAFQEVKKRRRVIDTAMKMYDKLEELEKALRPLFPILADDIEKLLKNARGEE